MSELREWAIRNGVKLKKIAKDLDISEVHLQSVLKGEHMSAKMKRKIDNYLAQKLQVEIPELPVKMPDLPVKKLQKKIKTQRVNFNYDTGKWDNFSDVYFNVLANSYKEVNIENELNKMSAWLMSNTNKRKSNFERFINVWLSKCQDKNTMPQRTQMLSFKQQANKSLEEWAQRKFNEITEKEERGAQDEKRKNLLENNK